MAHNATFSGRHNQGFQVGFSSGTINNIFNSQPAIKTTPKYQLGLSLREAPQTDDDLFVGRDTEVGQLEEWLSPTPKNQKVVVLSGLGGIGKTQLSIHFAKRHHGNYSSVIWLNAKDENTLKTEYLSLALRILGEEEHASETKQPDEGEAVQYVRQWLSQPENDKWLVIYDNYDDPQMPGIDSPTGYNIRHFFPDRTHGSILITTRSSRLTFAKQLRLLQLEDVHQSLAIVANRSGRETEGDPDARRLANRLGGLPLALTTAGASLSQSADSFGDYLQMYEESWEDLAVNSSELLEYADRTLYSTWNISLRQIEVQDPEAANLLRLMAYLSNLDLWYELFQKGADSGPTWFSNVMQSKARFNRAMAKLQEYSLIEARVGSYSLHTCVHDWTLESLNRDFDAELCGLAIRCVARSMKDDTEADYWLTNRRLVQHVPRWEYSRLKESVDWDSVDVRDVCDVATLHSHLGQLTVAVKWYQRALRSSEKQHGTESESWFIVSYCLGLVYSRQDKLAEAETIYHGVLKGYEKTENVMRSTRMFHLLNSLGLLYAKQGKLAEAEMTLKDILEKKEELLGVEHIDTIDTAYNLGWFYSNQGKFIASEMMYKRALQGYEKRLGATYTPTLDTVYNLGNVYARQGKFVEAEVMFRRVLEGYEKTLEIEDEKTLDTVYNLGSVYTEQYKFVEAEVMFRRALEGYEKILGIESESTLKTVHRLGILYQGHEKLEEAEVMYRRALGGYEKVT